MPGPVPKRSEQRRRVNAPARPLVKPVGAAPAPALGLDDAHPLAVELYEALKGSAEARFFTPAVWQRARVHVLVLSTLLRSSRMSSQMYAALQGDWKSLLVDPAEQRRLGIEVQAVAEVDVDAERADATVTSLMTKLGG